MKVGFIGLGRMGQGMAQRIRGAGHDLCVFDVLPHAEGLVLRELQPGVTVEDVRAKTGCDFSVALR